jgi:hypothetical protein
MSALNLLAEHGLSVAIEGDGLLVSPRQNLTDELREFIRANKPELRDLLRTWAELETAIHECCDIRGDSDKNREALLKDSREWAATDWPWLVWYFKQEGAKWTH